MNMRCCKACLVDAPGCQVVVQSLAVRQRVAGDALAGVEYVLAQATREAVGQVIAQALQVQRQALVEVLHRGDTESMGSFEAHRDPWLAVV